METMDSSIWRGDCSRCVQTNFPEEDDYDGIRLKNALELPKDLYEKRRRFSNLKNIHSFENIHLTDMR